MPEARCFECGSPATARHHVVPQSLGGTRTVPLCPACHRAVHSPDQPISLGRLNQLARRRRKIQWRCEICAELIDDNDGYVEVRSSELAANAEDERAWEEKHRDEHGWIMVTTAEFIEGPGLVRWHILHGRCDPEPDAHSYWIGVERIRNVAQLLEWTSHLLGKRWVQQTDWHELLEKIAQELAP